MIVDTTDTTGHGLLFDRLVKEHHEILARFAEVRALASDVPRRTAAFGRLAHQFRIHARAEEVVLFPYLDGSWELGHHVRKEVAQHRSIDARMKMIEASEWDDDDRWLAEVDAVLQEVLAYMADEEQVVLPHAHAVISDPSLRDLLVEYEQEEEFLQGQIP